MNFVNYICAMTGCMSGRNLSISNPVWTSIKNIGIGMWRNFLDVRSNSCNEIQILSGEGNRE